MAAPRAPVLRFLSAVFAVLAVVVTTATATQDGESILRNEFSRASNETLLWGPYRPNLYFGVKPRVPESFISGLMWSSVNDYKAFQESWCTLSRN